MRIAVDVDAVLYEWERTARYLLRNVYGLPWLTEPFTEWDLEPIIGEEAYQWLWSGGIENGLFRHGHVITGAMLGVRYLKSEGHDLVIVTHRPRAGVQDTLDWVSFHFGKEKPYPWSAFHILSDGQPKSSIDFDLLIDDSPANIEDACGHARRGILFGAAWNQSDTTWADIPTLIEGF